MSEKLLHIEDLEIQFVTDLETVYAVNGVSLDLEEGKTLGIVGETGAGKTTITNLINRFYDIPDGKIRFDGVNINKINKERET